MGGGNRPARTERLVAAFLLGLTLFMPPALMVASRDDQVGGIPVLFLWLFGGWLILIVLVAAAVETARDDGS